MAEPDSLKKKPCPGDFGQKWTIMGPKMQLFKFYEKSRQGIFEFLYEGTATWNLSLNLNYTFGKNVFRGFWAKGDQN